MPNGNGEEQIQSTQIYYAKSVVNDGQTWFNIVTFLSTIIAMPELMSFVPQEHRPLVVRAVLAFIAAGNVYLRIFHIKRPVAFIKSGDAKPVEVKTLIPTKKSGDC